MKRITFAARTIAILTSVLIAIYIISSNTVPFDVSKTYASNTNNELVLSPMNRIQTINGVSKQTDDLVYATNTMPFRFDHANVNMIFKNLSPNQEILIGYKDQASYHFNSRVIDAPFLDSLNWTKIGTGPYLYQKTPAYKSIKDFLNNPPKDKSIGIYDYTAVNFLQPNITIPEYSPSPIDTSITPYLRGSEALYAYVKNEPFKMSFTKRDLNWYADPDVMKITIYKDGEQVYEATIDDDGNSTANRQIGPSQTIEIKNPGPGLPEAGVYKVVINSNRDIVLTNIITNLHKLVFEGPINPITNKLVFPGLVNNTWPTDVYTNATNLSAQTYHAQALQTLLSGSQSFKLANVSQEIPISLGPSDVPLKLTAPQSDVVINGIGFFAFNPDQYFEPSPYKVLQISNASDLGQVDYVLTDYEPPVKQNGWLVAHRQFDLHDASIQKGNLSWLISAPGLKDSKGSVEYKQIQMTLTKKGWWR